MGVGLTTAQLHRVVFSAGFTEGKMKLFKKMQPHCIEHKLK
jgi:hypothetical protein